MLIVKILLSIILVLMILFMSVAVRIYNLFEALLNKGINVEHEVIVSNDNIDKLVNLVLDELDKRKQPKRKRNKDQSSE